MSNEFDLKTAIKEYACPLWLKKGFCFYLKNNNIVVKNKKEFNKKIEDYLNLPIGG